MTDPNQPDRDDAHRPRILDNETSQRSARTDPSMRDGDSGHGNPYESGDDPDSTDADVGDATGVEIDVAEGEAVVDGTPVESFEAPDAPTALDSPASADVVGALVAADDKSDQNHTAQAGPTTEQVAARLGEAPDPGLPIPDYQRLTVAQVVERLGALSPDEVRAVRAYEASHRQRKTLLRQIDRRLAGDRRAAET